MANAPNWLDLGLSEEQQERVRKGAELYKATYVNTIDNVFEIANCIDILRTANYGTGVQGGFADALVQYGYTNREGGAIDKGIRSNFNALLENEDAVRAWWKDVDEKKKRDWVSARAIYRNWQASLKPPPTEEEKANAKAKKIEAAKKLLGLKPDAPVPMAADWVPAGIGAKPSADAMIAKQAANAEAMADKHEINDLKARVVELEGELTSAHVADAPFDLRSFLTRMLDRVTTANVSANLPGPLTRTMSKRVTSLVTTTRLALIELGEIYEEVAGPSKGKGAAKGTGKGKAEPKGKAERKGRHKAASLQWTGQRPWMALDGDGGKYRVFRREGYTTAAKEVFSYVVEYTPAGTGDNYEVTLGSGKTLDDAKAIAEAFNSEKGTVRHDVLFKSVQGSGVNLSKIGSAKTPKEAKACAEADAAKKAKAGAKKPATLVWSDDSRPVAAAGDGMEYQIDYFGPMHDESERGHHVYFKEVGAPAQATFKIGNAPTEEAAKALAAEHFARPEAQLVRNKKGEVVGLTGIKL